MFDPGLKIGQILKNADIVDTFKCGNMGGMRKQNIADEISSVDYSERKLYLKELICDKK